MKHMSELPEGVNISIYLLFASLVIPDLFWPITFSTKLILSLTFRKGLRKFFIILCCILSIYKIKLEKLLMHYFHWEQLFILFLVMRVTRTTSSLYYVISSIDSKGQSLKRYPWLIHLVCRQLKEWLQDSSSFCC